MGDITNTEKPGGARVTIPAVELVKVGVHGGHALTEKAKADKEKNGGVKVTAQHIADMVAADADNFIDEAPIKFSHFTQLGDAAPAAGWIQNLRTTDNGNTLVGDLVDIPAGLYPLIKTGFKRRSVEMKYDQTGEEGKQYSAVLSAIALLGTEAPAVKNLADLADLYASSVDTDKDTVQIPHSTDAALEDSNNTAQQGEPNNKEDLAVNVLEAIKEKLGLAADATDEEVTAAIDSLLEAAAAASADDEDENGSTAAAASALSAAGAETVTVSNAVFLSMQATLADLQEREVERENEQLIEAALSAGKISTSEAEIYLTQLKDKKTRAGAMALLSAMPENKVNVISAGLPAPKLSDEDVAARWAAQNK